ncbi:hypothetical protein ACFYYN_35740 [Streptomyces sp. NPDC001902]
MTKNSSTSPDPASGPPQQQNPNVSTRRTAQLKLPHHLDNSTDLDTQLAGTLRPTALAATGKPTRHSPPGSTQNGNTSFGNRASDVLPHQSLDRKTRPGRVC